MKFLMNELTSHMPSREAGRVMMNRKNPKKIIFDSCKLQHIPLEHDWEVYLLAACLTNTSTTIYIKE
jgi:hypothetical protein